MLLLVHPLEILSLTVSHYIPSTDVIFLLEFYQFFITENHVYKQRSNV